MRISQISLYVTDAERTRDFFTETLGFEVKADFPAGDTRWVEISPPGSDITVSLVTSSMPVGGDDKIGGFSGISFETDEINELYDELIDKGVTVDSEPVKEDYGKYLLTFRDPDDNQFFVFQPVK